MCYYTSDLHNIMYMRTNVYKDKILIFLKKNHLLSISDIHKKIGNVDYSTIYRNIAQLTREKKIKKVVFGKRNVMYEIVCARNQHEHFLCLDCGDIKKTYITPKTINLPPKHKIIDVVVKGLCARCH